MHGGADGLPIVTVPVGPQHPALHEPLLLRVHLSGEEVVGVEIVTGYNHRGIEKLAEEHTWLQALYIVTRVCGICNMMHSTCYTQALEEILGVKPPPRALALRTLAMELERMHSHMLLAAVMAENIGLTSLFMQIMKEREAVMHAKEVLTGNRVIADYVWPGGVRRDITPEQAERIRGLVRQARKALAWIREVYESDSLIAERLEGVGKISGSEAVRYGLMGPTLRASGIDFDTRRAYPYAWYPELSFEVKTRKEGDCLARVLLRIDEAEESARIIEEILDRLPGGPIRGLKVPPRVVKPGESVSRVEAPRGELLYHVVSRGGRKPYRVKIRTPSFPNILNTVFAYRGALLSDVPVILTSFDPCISCMERLLVVDEDTGEERVVSVRSLLRRRSKAGR